MKFLAIFVLFVALAAASSIRSQAQDNLPITNHYIINTVNAAQTSWKAGVNPRMEGMTVAEFKRLLGVKPAKQQIIVDEVSEVRAVPTNFDSRQQWPNCIGPILDQGHCGSCWAFGAVESLQDRICIATNASAPVALSEQELVSCDSTNDGCDGGDPLSAWVYLMKTGTPTNACYPYEMGNCSHPGCSEWSTPSCKKKCADGSSYKDHEVKAGSAYSVNSNPDAIATEIFSHGPVEVAFTVYEDFAHYVSGIYHHVSGAPLGGHAVKAIGWGVENGTEYWLIQNSWNTNWGMDGLFKIRKGTDECGIEDDVVAGLYKSQ